MYTKLHPPQLQSPFAQSHQDPGDPHHAERLPGTAPQAAALPRRLGGVICGPGVRASVECLGLFELGAELQHCVALKEKKIQ